MQDCATSTCNFLHIYNRQNASAFEVTVHLPAKYRRTEAPLFFVETIEEVGIDRFNRKMLRTLFGEREFLVVQAIVSDKVVDVAPFPN